MEQIIEPTVNEVWNDLQHAGRVFLTGSSGTGKTVMSNALMEKAEDVGWKVYPTATTGVAARNLNKRGTTIHSTLMMGISNNIEEYNQTRFSRFTSCKISNHPGLKVLLVIDEISMFSSAQFELMIHIIESKVRDSSVSILLVGDFLQLPAITKGSSKINYCFHSSEFNSFKKRMLLVNKRNTDYYWNIFLGRIRNGIFDQNDLNFLNELDNIIITNQPEQIESKPIVMMSTNREVLMYNLKMLSTLETDYKNVDYILVENKSYLFEALGPIKEVPQWIENNTKRLIKEFGDMNFTFKVGSKVMITKNDHELGIINGDTGIITSFDEEQQLITVKIDGRGDNVFEFGRTKHEIFHPNILEKETKTLYPVAIIEHFPLKLGYAVSVHKAQGSSFTSMYFDPTNVFVPGQTFVALSRLRTNGTLYIPTTNLFNHIFADQTAVNYVQSIEQNQAIELAESRENPLPIIEEDKDSFLPPEIEIDEDEIPF